MRRNSFCFGVVLMLACSGCAHAPPPPQTALDDRPPQMLSAFFGLDHAMPGESRWLCREAPGKDGMPVTFSRRVLEPVDANAFTVITRSGARLHPACATAAPANAPAKHHTILLMGELGSEPNDPPVKVEISGSLPLEGGVDAKGLEGEVIPLAAGPTLVMALGLPPGSIESDCPNTTQQLVVVVWAGGVKPGPDSDQEAHRKGYRVSTAEGEVTPFALGDLHDRDNYVHLCLDTKAPAQRVSFSAGLLVDPRGDLNPDTAIEVSAAK